MEPVSIISTHFAMNDFRSETMRRSYESLIRTTKHLPVEIIIVDNGGSEDDSKYLLDLCQKKEIQHYVRNAQNLYFGFGRNIGFALSHGKYIVFADNDIEYKDGWLEKCVALIEAYPEKKYLVTPLRTDREHRNHRHWMGTIEYQGENYLLNLRAGSNCWLVKRENFLEIGYFRNHYIAGSKWNDSFVKKGYLMITMEKDSLATDIGFKRGYDHRTNVEIKKVFTNYDELIINT